jgi:hypothetical protein
MNAPNFQQLVKAYGPIDGPQVYADRLREAHRDRVLAEFLGVELPAPKPEVSA